MRTHYCRRPKKAGMSNRLNTPLEGIVYQAVPDDRLVAMPDVARLVAAEARRHNEPAPDEKGLAGVVSDLVSRGFLAEVHGARLERVVESS